MSAERLMKAFIASRWGWAAAGLFRPPGTVVFMYHRVGPASDHFPTLDVQRFREHVTWLRDNCRIVSPEELQDSVATSSRKRPVLLTFDDGYKGYFDHVYPILKELEVPALVFLSTAFVDDPARLFPWDALHLAVWRTRSHEVVLPWGTQTRVAIPNDAARAQLYTTCRRHLKHLPEPEQSEQQSRLLERLEISSADLHVPRQVLSWDEVRATMPLTRYGGHTHNHPIMSRLGTEALENEIRLCRERITAETGAAPKFFAYPNGHAGDFNEEAKTLLRRHGFEIAFAAIEGLAQADADWMAVLRIPPARRVSDLAWQVAALTAGRRTGSRSVSSGRY